MSARDELAKLLFVTDNNAAPEPEHEWEMTARHNPAYAEYAYVQADAILAAGYSKPRTITTAEELDALARGTVVTSPNWMDAFSRNEWKWGLTNVATGHKQQLADLPEFLPAHVIHETRWSK